MKIYLYLYQYELTFEGVWNCLFFPNVGENLYIIPFLAEEDKKVLANIRCGDAVDDLRSIVLQQTRNELYLLPMLSNHSCFIEQKTWNYIGNEWICSFELKI